MSSPVWLVVGLGNPGPRYERTRHNAGARAVEKLASSFGEKLKTSRLQAWVASTRTAHGKLLLARPSTYMNESGIAVSRLLHHYKIEPENMVVMYDDIDLGFCTLRVKFGGGTGGQHGLESIVDATGHRDFYRVRIGVGRPASPLADPGKFVLEPLSKKAESELSQAEEEAGEAAVAIISDGLERAMNRFNQKGTGHGGRGSVPKVN